MTYDVNSGGHIHFYIVWLSHIWAELDFVAAICNHMKQYVATYHHFNHF